jgi:hypothetical protein
MFAELLSKLDHPMKAELYRRHVSPGLVGDWKAGRRLPTEVQVAHLAAVTHANWQDLQREITVLRAKPEERDEVAKVVGWRKR